jgi:hypothetical protein
MAVIAGISIGITITVEKLQCQTKRPAQAGLFLFMSPSFRDDAKDQTAAAQWRVGESRDSGLALSRAPE